MSPVSSLDLAHQVSRVSGKSFEQTCINWVKILGIKPIDFPLDLVSAFKPQLKRKLFRAFGEYEAKRWQITQPQVDWVNMDPEVAQDVREYRKIMMEQITRDTIRDLEMEALLRKMLSTLPESH